VAGWLYRAGRWLGWVRRFGAELRSRLPCVVRLVAVDSVPRRYFQGQVVVRSSTSGHTYGFGDRTMGSG
jgi:hypothetical protein